MAKKTNPFASAEGCTNFCPPKNENVPQNFSQGDKLSPSDQILAQTLSNSSPGFFSYPEIRMFQNGSKASGESNTFWRTPFLGPPFLKYGPLKLKKGAHLTPIGQFLE